MFLTSDSTGYIPSLLEADVDPDGTAGWARHVTPGSAPIKPLVHLAAGRFSAAGKLDAIAAYEAQIAFLQARQLELVAAFDDDVVPQDELERSFATEELSCALRVSHTSAHLKIKLARDLTDVFPDTLAALNRGAITVGHARLLVEHTDTLDLEQRRDIEARVLPGAAGQSHPEFRRAVRKARQAVDTRAAEQRHEAAMEQRTVTKYDGEDGMAGVWANLPAAGAQVLWDRIDAMAKACCEHDVRTMDQRRADALVELAAGGVPGEAVEFKPQIHVTVAMSTLLEVDDQPAELTGHGPIPAALARELAADPSGTWRRLVTDPLGQLIDLGRAQYRPPAGMQRHVKARDKTCRFPHCEQPAARTDTDHVLDWNLDGETNPANLQSLCRRHHHTKHDGGWRVSRTDQGEARWTSPRGKQYVKEPARYADPDPPPF